MGPLGNGRHRKCGVFLCAAAALMAGCGRTAPHAVAVPTTAVQHASIDSHLVETEQDGKVCYDFTSSSPDVATVDEQFAKARDCVDPKNNTLLVAYEGNVPSGRYRFLVGVVAPGITAVHAITRSGTDLAAMRGRAFSVVTPDSLPWRRLEAYAGSSLVEAVDCSSDTCT